MLPLVMEERLHSHIKSLKQIISGKKTELKFGFRRLTSPMRVLPDFLIIGAQKCGTTSLYLTLAQHLNVKPAFVKEVRYFNNFFEKGVNWYRAHYPSHLYRYLNNVLYSRDFITGEGEPSYLPNPIAPQRVFGLIPEVKLIVMLRNPVDRAYSHYNHRIQRGREKLSFEEVVQLDKETLKNGWGNIETRDYKSLGTLHYSYLPRGIYVDQLKVWMDVFPKEQFLVIKAEDYFTDTRTIFNKVLAFLNLPESDLVTFQKSNTGKYKKKMSATMRQDLIDYFYPHNQRLYAYLGVDYDWDK